MGRRILQDHLLPKLMESRKLYISGGQACRTASGCPTGFGKPPRLPKLMESHKLYISGAARPAGFFNTPP
jgi:hypothetical protein